jgi:hypothetical protein
MSEYKFANYALWFNLKYNNEEVILKGINEIYKTIKNNYSITPEIKFDFKDMFIKVGENFFLIKAESHWSPGDISGMFKLKYLQDDEEVMALLINREYYLPHHGLIYIDQKKLSDWHSFPDKYKLIKKNT